MEELMRMRAEDDTTKTIIAHNKCVYVFDDDLCFYFYTLFHIDKLTWDPALDT